MRFVDTNVLIYSVSAVAANARKREVAEQLIVEGKIAVSVQVLQEFYTQATRESRPGRISKQAAREIAREFLRGPVQPMTVELFESALVTHERFQINYWDAAIIEAARALGCRAVLSEDLQHGQDYGGVHVENPFL